MSTRIDPPFDYAALTRLIDQGFALQEFILDAQGRVEDYRFLEVNAVFAGQLGLKPEALVGAAAGRTLPGLEPFGADRYAGLADGQGELRFEAHSTARDAWFEVHAFAAGLPRFGVLTTDISAKKRLQEQLSLDDSRFKAITNSMEDFLCTIDRDGRYSAVYGKSLERYGIPAAELVGKTARECLGGAPSPVHEAAMAKALRGEISVHECDILGRGLRGAPVLQMVFSPIFQKGHVLGIVGVGRDITEFKKNQIRMKDLLDEKLVLLREVQHRVKNNLQIIISLIQLELSCAADGRNLDGFRVLQSRIYAISSVHDVLSSSLVSGRVSLAALLRTIASFCVGLSGVFAGIKDIKVQADEGILLPVETALPVALILHECLLGYARNAASTIVVDAEHSGPDACRLRLTPARGQAYGPVNENSDLLLAGMIEQIRGRMDAEPSDDGTSTIVFPLAGAGRPIFPV